jgi:hypothetical protein
MIHGCAAEDRKGGGLAIHVGCLGDRRLRGRHHRAAAASRQSPKAAVNPLECVSESLRSTEKGSGKRVSMIIVTGRPSWCCGILSAPDDAMLVGSFPKKKDCN